MKDTGMNRKNGKLNVLLGATSQVIILLCSIIIPRLIIKTYGSETNGLVNSLTQIYNYAALLEMGVSTASVMTIFKAIADKDQQKVNTVISTTANYYKRTGLIYLTIVIGVSIVYPFVIQSAINPVEVFLVAIITGMASALTYIVQGKYSVILQSYGKLYVISTSQMIMTVVSQLMKVLIMWMGYSVVWIQLSYLLLTVIKILYIRFYTKRAYPNIVMKEEPDYSLIKERKNVMVHQVSGLIFSSTDSILLSLFTNLTIVSVYSVYNMVMTSLSSLITTLSNSYNYLLANIYNKEPKKYLAYHEKFETAYFLLVFPVYTTTFLAVTKFVYLYTNGISTNNYVDDKLSLLFVLVALLSAARNPLAKLIDFSKQYKETQNRVLAEMIINISVSLIAISKLGIYGALIGTIVALLYRVNDIIIYVNRRILNRSCQKTYIKFGMNFLLFFLFVVINRWFEIPVNSYLMLLLYAAVVFVISIGMYIALNFILNSNDVVWILRYVQKNFGIDSLTRKILRR